MGTSLLEVRMQTITLDEIRALRLKDVTTRYGLSRSTLYKLMGEGNLRSVKVGGRRLIPRDAIEALIAGGDK
jgi:excisionase family DNA binding protein